MTNYIVIHWLHLLVFSGVVRHRFCQSMRFYPFPGRTNRSENYRFRVIPVILWKQYSGRKIFGFFPMISCRKAQKVDRNPPEKIRTIFGRNTTSMFQRFPVFSCRIRWVESSTWVFFQEE